MNEEYGEALMLAQQYGLNCDLVYLRQWRSYPVSIATIQDYLVSILLCCNVCTKELFNSAIN